MAIRMVNGITAMWAIEEIPDEDALYMRAQRGYFRDGELIPGVFRDRQGAMSTDWSKYSTPEQSRSRARTPEDNAIIQLAVGRVRQEAKQSVQHEPIPENRAHTNVYGQKDAEARVQLLRICRTVLPLDDPGD